MAMAASDPNSRELIQTVSMISNNLMGEVSKVIIGKKKISEKLQSGYYLTEICC